MTSSSRSGLSRAFESPLASVAVFGQPAEEPIPSGSCDVASRWSEQHPAPQIASSCEMTLHPTRDRPPMTLEVLPRSSWDILWPLALRMVVSSGPSLVLVEIPVQSPGWSPSSPHTGRCSWWTPHVMVLSIGCTDERTNWHTGDLREPLDETVDPIWQFRIELDDSAAPRTTAWTGRSLELRSSGPESPSRDDRSGTWWSQHDWKTSAVSGFGSWAAGVASEHVIWGGQSLSTSHSKPTTAGLSLSTFGFPLSLISIVGVSLASQLDSTNLLGSCEISWVCNTVCGDGGRFSDFRPRTDCASRAISQMSRRNSFLSERRSGAVHPSFSKWTCCLAVWMTAPNWRKTLLEMRNGVTEGTMATLSHMWPIGIINAWSHATVPLLPNRKDIATGLSKTCCRRSLGNCRRSSSFCWKPMTDWEAPRSTMPRVPWLAKWTWWSPDESFSARLCFMVTSLSTHWPLVPDLSSGTWTLSGLEGVTLGSWNVIPRCCFRILDRLWRNRCTSVQVSSPKFLPWSLSLECLWVNRLKTMLHSCTTGKTEKFNRLYTSSNWSVHWSTEEPAKMMSDSFGSMSFTTNAFATWLPEDASFARSGHSFFQWPRLWQILHSLVAIRSASDLRRGNILPLPRPLPNDVDE